MNFIETKLKDCFIVEPDIFTDERGFFLESYNKKKYRKILDESIDFVQDNHSQSSKGVLRGMHIQKNNQQGKLVRVTRGKVLDIAVDCRKESTSYGKWESVILTEKNKRQFWIPPGFAHGFLVLSDNTDLMYKCTGYYDPADEIAFKWDDPDLMISWPIENPILSEKDRVAKPFRDLKL